MFEYAILIISIIFLLAAIISTVVFKVPDIHIAIPSSIFSGRIKSEKEEGYESGDKNTKSGFFYSIPIKGPYGEGINFKWPWWSVRMLKRDVKTRKIEAREFPVGKGGTVIVSGVIQYRTSDIAAYRFEEVSEAAIEEGLNSEIEQTIRGTLVDEDVDSAIKKTFEISDNLERLLKSTDIRTREEKERATELAKKEASGETLTQEETIECSRVCKPRSRDLFGRPVTYAEQAYGIEVLKAKIERVDPTPDLKISRDAKQREVYERESQITEWSHLLERGGELSKLLSTPEGKKAWEAVQLWQEQATKEIKKIEIEGTGADSLTGVLAGLSGLFAGGKKDDKKS